MKRGAGVSIVVAIVLLVLFLPIWNFSVTGEPIKEIDGAVESIGGNTLSDDSNCGDGVIDVGEECDGTNLGGLACRFLSFDYGTLSCFPEGSLNECTFDTSGCLNNPEGFVCSRVYLDSGSDKLFLGDPLGKNVQTLTKDDLSFFLMDGYFEGNVDTGYESTISIGQYGSEIVFGNHPTPKDPEVMAVLLSTVHANSIYNLTLTFDEAIDFTHLNSEGKILKMFGEEYVVGEETNSEDLVLYRGTEKFILRDGAEVRFGIDEDVMDGVLVSRGWSSSLGWNDTNKITFSIIASDSDFDAIVLGSYWQDPFTETLRINFESYDDVNGAMINFEGCLDSSACTPWDPLVACMMAGVECGLVSDGCVFGSYDCGSCSSGEFCDGGICASLDPTECETNGDCSPGFECINELCVENLCSESYLNRPGVLKLFVGDVINKYVETLDDSELPSLLSRGEFGFNTKTAFRQVIDVTNHSKIRDDLPSWHDLPEGTIGIVLSDTVIRPVYSLHVDFNGSVDFTNEDSIGSFLRLLGETYYVAGAPNTTYETLSLIRTYNDYLELTHGMPIYNAGREVEGTLVILEGDNWTSATGFTLNFAIDDPDHEVVQIGQSWENPVFETFNLVFESYDEINGAYIKFGGCEEECYFDQECPSEYDRYCTATGRCTSSTHYSCMNKECIVVGGGQSCTDCPYGCTDGVCKPRPRKKTCKTIFCVGSELIERVF